MTEFVAAVCFLVGLAVGSFVNVVAYRVPRDMSVVSPPSACPQCGQSIRPRDNIPVVSWLLLRGRCRDCGEPISPRYPIVELGTAVAFAGTVYVVGVGWRLPAYLFFVAVTIALTLTDLDHKRIPNRILYPAIPAAIALLAVAAVGEGEWSNLGRGLLGAAAYFGLWLVVAVITRGGFGMGDVKLSFLLGLYLAYDGWSTLVVGLFGAVLIGGVISVLLLVTGQKGRRDQVPFGPSLIAGAWIALLWGESLTNWWLS